MKMEFLKAAFVFCWFTFGQLEMIKEGELIMHDSDGGKWTSIVRYAELNTEYMSFYDKTTNDTILNITGMEHLQVLEHATEFMRFGISYGDGKCLPAKVPACVKWVDAENEAEKISWISAITEVFQEASRLNFNSENWIELHTKKSPQSSLSYVILAYKTYSAADQYCNQRYGQLASFASRDELTPIYIALQNEFNNSTAPCYYKFHTFMSIKNNSWVSRGGLLPKDIDWNGNNAIPNVDGSVLLYIGSWRKPKFHSGSSHSRQLHAWYICEIDPSRRTTTVSTSKGTDITEVTDKNWSTEKMITLMASVALLFCSGGLLYLLYRYRHRSSITQAVPKSSTIVPDSYSLDSTSCTATEKSESSPLRNSTTPFYISEGCRKYMRANKERVPPELMQLISKYTDSVEAKPGESASTIRSTRRSPQSSHVADERRSRNPSGARPHSNGPTKLMPINERTGYSVREQPNQDATTYQTSPIKPTRQRVSTVVPNSSFTPHRTSTKTAEQQTPSALQNYQSNARKSTAINSINSHARPSGQQVSSIVPSIDRSSTVGREPSTVPHTLAVNSIDSGMNTSGARFPPVSVDSETPEPKLDNRSRPMVRSSSRRQTEQNQIAE